MFSRLLSANQRIQTLKYLKESRTYIFEIKKQVVDILYILTNNISISLFRNRIYSDSVLIF